MENFKEIPELYNEDEPTLHSEDNKSIDVASFFIDKKKEGGIHVYRSGESANDSEPTKNFDQEDTHGFEPVNRFDRSFTPGLKTAADAQDKLNRFRVNSKDRNAKPVSKDIDKNTLRSAAGK